MTDEKPPRAPRFADGLADALDPYSGAGDLVLGDVNDPEYVEYLAALEEWNDRRQAATKEGTP